MVMASITGEPQETGSKESTNRTSEKEKAHITTAIASTKLENGKEEFYWKASPKVIISRKPRLSIQLFRPYDRFDT